MCPHRQVNANVNAEVADERHWRDGDVINQHISCRQLLVLTQTSRTPQHLSIVGVQLQPVQPRPGCNGVDVLGNPLASPCYSQQLVNEFSQHFTTTTDLSTKVKD